jgi:lambda repressor-like predicted transcriptional regulator
MTTSELPSGAYDDEKIAAIISGLYRLHKKGWSLSALMNECDLSAADVMRLNPEAARYFSVLRRAYPHGRIPDAFPPVRVEVIERKPKRFHDKVIAFRPSRDSNGKIIAKWRSLAPTFIDDGKWDFVESRRSAPVKKAFKDAFACAERTAGIMWIDDPKGLFPPQDRSKSK